MHSLVLIKGITVYQQKFLKQVYLTKLSAGTRVSLIRLCWGVIEPGGNYGTPTLHHGHH
jgi:hypothetical protein